MYESFREYALSSRRTCPKPVGGQVGATTNPPVGKQPSSTWLHQHRDKQRKRLDSFVEKTANGEDGDDNCRYDKLTVLRNSSVPHTKPQLLCRGNSSCL